jgi:hypothetical protein
MEWQATHLLSKLSLPCAASSSVGVADAGSLWCSISVPSTLAAVEMSPIAPREALAKWWSTMMYEPSSGITNSTVALLEDPSKVVCIAPELIVQVTLDAHAVEDRPDDMEARRFARANVEHVEPHALAGPRRQGLPHHAVVHAIEDGVGGLRGAQASPVEHV